MLKGLVGVNLVLRGRLEKTVWENYFASLKFIRIFAVAFER